MLRGAPSPSRSHGAEADVEIGEGRRAEAHPGPRHVAVQAADAPVDGEACRCLGQVTQRMAAQRAAAEENHAHPDAERHRAGRGIGEPQSLPDVVRQEDEDEIEEIAVDVLEDERERALAEIAPARLAHRACRRIGPERLVIDVAVVVVAGEVEAARSPEDEERRGPWDPSRPPAGLALEPTGLGVAEDLRGVERRQIGTGPVVRPWNADDERGGSEEDRQRLCPPHVLPRSLATEGPPPENVCVAHERCVLARHVRPRESTPKPAGPGSPEVQRY
jgi:hypothetical protein